MLDKVYKYHIVTFGCQMNKSDSERISSVLMDFGMEETEFENEADLILLNTCSVRQTAEDRVFGMIHKYHNELRKNNPNLILGITGCMPGRDTKKAFWKRLPMVDLYFKIDEMIKLPEWLNSINPNIKKNNKFDTNYPLDYMNLSPKYKNSYQMFLPIQTGCNRFCTYCVVPFSRGLERNRKLEDILTEAKTFLENGGKEITLLGQTVNSYQFPESSNTKLSHGNPYKSGFAALLYELNMLDGLSRIFYTAPHPDDMDDECIDALALPKMLNYLHLPVQSGSDKILKLMKRSYTRNDYLTVINKIRKKIPNISLGTDIIVGFCDETHEDFLDTVSLYNEVEFDISYTAKYSVRSGTFAAKKYQDNVSYEDKKKRWNTMQKLMEKITFKKNQQYLNKNVEVLFDKFEDGLSTGWSREMKMVQVKHDQSLVSKIHSVKINKAMTWMLEGEI